MIRAIFQYWRRAVTTILRPHRPRMGIRGKLFVSVGVIAGTTVASGIVGSLFLDQVRGQVAVIAGVNLPIMDQSKQLVEEVSAIVSLGFQLNGATTDPARQQINGTVETLGKTLSAHLDRLATRYGGADGDPALRKIINLAGFQTKSMLDNLHILNDKVKERLESQARQVAVMTALDRDQEVFVRASRDLAASHMAGGAIAKKADCLELMAAITDAKDLMDQALATSDADLLKTLKDRFDRQRTLIEGVIKGASDLGPLPAQSARILAYGQNVDGIFAQHAVQLASANLSAAVVAKNQEMANKVNLATGEFSKIAQERTDASTKAAVLASHRAELWQIAIALASVLIAVLIAWLYIGPHIVARLRALARVMRTIAQGTLDMPIPQGGRDEIAEMADALVVFRDTAVAAEAAKRRLADQERDIAARRREAILAVAGTFERSVQSVVGEVTTTSVDVYSGAQTVSSMASQTSREVTIATQASDLASRSAADAATAAGQLSLAIAEISRQMTESTRILQVAAHDADQTDSTIHSLTDAADQIGDVIKVINSIAAQTSMLALNATIEAARAGDAGKGFAVVASEVKSLANQTAMATQAVGRHVSEIQSVTQRAVETIKGIAATITKIDQIDAAIAAAVEEQHLATQEIARSVAQAASSANDVSTSLGGVSRVAGEAGQSAEHLQRAAGVMADQAESLSQEVKRFLGEVRGNNG